MKYFIIAMLICAVTLCAALVSVSLAAWAGGGATYVSAEGNVGQFYVDYPQYVDGSTDTLNPPATVRRVNASTVGGGSTFTYHNYICVSRVESSEASSIAFLEFEVEALDDTVLENVEVQSITIARQGTYQADDEGGAYKAGDLDGKSRMAPRIYGAENIKTLADINDKPETVASIKDRYKLDTLYDEAHMTDHVTGGIFCILYFSDNDRYYATDITVTTSSAARFRLTATANNVNRRQRYVSGYGQPFGFYLGGHINGVDNRDPRYTTHMKGTTATSYDPSLFSEETYFDEIYKDYDYSQFYYYDYNKYGASVDPSVGDDENLSQTFKYPKHVDVALNLTLTAGSNIKMYMLDGVGDRQAKTNDGKTANNKTLYFVPQNITYYGFGQNQAPSFTIKDGTTDFDISIPEDGEYTIHFFGDVSYKFDGSREKGKKETNNYMTETATETVRNPDGSTTLKYTLATDKGSDDMYSFIADGHCSVENLRITRKEQDIAAPEHTVSFVNPKSEGGMIAAQSVSDKGSPTEPSGSAVVADIYKVVGYYKGYDPYISQFVDEITNLTETVIRQDTIIFVRWEKFIDIRSRYGTISLTLPDTVGAVHCRNGENVYLDADTDKLTHISAPDKEWVNIIFTGAVGDRSNQTHELALMYKDGADRTYEIKSANNGVVYPITVHNGFFIGEYPYFDGFEEANDRTVTVARGNADCNLSNEDKHGGDRSLKITTTGATSVVVALDTGMRKAITSSSQFAFWVKIVGNSTAKLIASPYKANDRDYLDNNDHRLVLNEAPENEWRQVVFSAAQTSRIKEVGAITLYAENVTAVYADDMELIEEDGTVTVSAGNRTVVENATIDLATFGGAGFNEESFNVTINGAPFELNSENYDPETKTLSFTPTADGKFFFTYIHKNEYKIKAVTQVLTVRSAIDVLADGERVSPEEGLTVKSVTMEELEGKALHLAFKFVGDTGKFGLDFMDGDHDWANITGSLTIEKKADGSVTSNIGRIVEEADGWYAWELNKVDFGGDKALLANEVSLVYHQGETVQGGVIINWGALQAVNAYNDSAVEYTDGDGIFKYLNYGGVTFDKNDGLSALHFRFKFTGDVGKFEFAFMDNHHTPVEGDINKTVWYNLTDTITVTKTADGAIVANAGRIIEVEGEDGWYAWELNYSLFDGDGAESGTAVNLVYSADNSVQGGVAIDWTSLKTVQAYNA